VRNIIYIIPLFLIFSCGGSGIEGYVDEPITFTANNPEESQDVDYFWSLTNQPDGSLINSGDLISSNDGQEMVFTPDYPGDYSIEVIVSQYGDEVSNQTWSFTILEYNSKELDNEIATENEDWLNEELIDSIDNENLTTIKPEDEEEYEEEDYEEEEDEEEEDYEEEEDEEEEEVLNERVISTTAKKVSQLNTTDRIASIAARTDRYTIQITSKKMLKDAQLFSQRLIKQGYDSYIQKAVFNSDEVWYRVRVGSYDNYDSAKIAADNLSDDLKMNTWVDFVRKEQ
tara:strand:- start:371 stop:1225 length:855 start_codon:yes stop_codon:yes gene_type:complete